MTLALHSINDGYKKLPPAIGWFPESEDRKPGAWRPAPHGTVFFHVLPFIEANNIHRRTEGTSATSFGAVVPTFIAPLDHTVPVSGLHPDNRGAISYGANTYAFMNYRDFVNHGYNVNGYIGTARKAESCNSLSEITKRDGTSNTIAFAERFAACWTPIMGADGRTTGWRRFERAWGESLQDYNHFSPAVFRPLDQSQGKPGQVQAILLPEFGADRKSCQPGTWQAFGDHVIQVSLFDGSVKMVTPDITLRTWSNALLPDDGLEMGRDW